MFSRWKCVALGIGLSACAAVPSGAGVKKAAVTTGVASTPSGSRRVASAPAAASLGDDDTSPPTSRVRFLLGWGSALLTDGRLVLPAGVEAHGPETLLQRGLLWARGDGFLELLRDGSVSPAVPSFFETRDVIRLSRSGACLLTGSGEIWCHGFSRSQRFEAPAEDSIGLHWYRLMTQGAPRALQVDGTSAIGCAVLETGEVDCWGGSAPLGLSSFPSPIVQAAVSSVGGYESGYHICLLNRDGEVGCWGSGTAGQLGYMAAPGKDVDVEPRRHAPRPPRRFLRFPRPAREIYAFPDQSCALLDDGELWCWGDTGQLLLQGQTEPSEYWMRLFPDPNDTARPLEIGASTLPQAPVALPGDCAVTQVLPLPAAVCVLCNSGCAKCWNRDPPRDCLTFASGQ